MNKPIKRLSFLTVSAKKHIDADLIDVSTGIVVTPISKEYSNSYYKATYANLWLGDFTLRKGNRKSTNISTRKTCSYMNENISYKILVKLVYINGSKYFRPIKDYYIRKLNRLGWNYSLRQFERLTAVCNYLSKEALVNIGRKAQVVPTPIDLSSIEKVQSSVKLKSPSVLMIQNHQIKQKSESLVSFKDVIKELPNVTFYISKGLLENRNNENYQKVISALSPLDNVKFVDIDSSNKYDYLKSADIYVLRSGLDCTPATILEAGLAKKPVLASSVGGVPEIIQQSITGWAIDNSDDTEWKKRISQLSTDKALAHRMGNESYKHIVSTYDITSVASKLYDYLTN